MRANLVVLRDENMMEFQALTSRVAINSVTDRRMSKRPTTLISSSSELSESE